MVDLLNQNIRLTAILNQDSYIFIGTNKGHVIRIPLNYIVPYSHQASLWNSTLNVRQNTNSNFLKLYTNCHVGSVKFIVSHNLVSLKTFILITGGDGRGTIIPDEFDSTMYHHSDDSYHSFIHVWENT